MRKKNGGNCQGKKEKKKEKKEKEICTFTASLSPHCEILIILSYILSRYEQDLFVLPGSRGLLVPIQEWVCDEIRTAVE